MSFFRAAANVEIHGADDAEHKHSCVHLQDALGVFAHGAVGGEDAAAGNVDERQARAHGGSAIVVYSRSCVAA